MLKWLQFEVALESGNAYTCTLKKLLRVDILHTAKVAPGRHCSYTSTSKNRGNYLT